MKEVEIRTHNLLILLILLAVGCGRPDGSRQQQFTDFINSNNGVEFKAPSKIQLAYNQENSQNSVSDILLTIDTDGSFHMRSDIPSGSLSNQGELLGTTGEWEIGQTGELALYQQGQLIAQSTWNGGNQNTYSLNFVQPIDLEIVQKNTMNGFNGGDFTSYSIINYTVTGYQILLKN